MSVADKETIDDQIQDHRIKIYVYNSQNVTPDVQAQLNEVQGRAHPGGHHHRDAAAGLAPRYQAWQTRQLRGHRGRRWPGPGLPPARRQGGRAGAHAPAAGPGRCVIEDAAVRLGGSDRLVPCGPRGRRRAVRGRARARTAWASRP